MIIKILFCCLTTKSLDVDRDVSTAYCKSSASDGVDWFRHSIMYHDGLLRLVHFDPVIVSVYHGFHEFAPHFSPLSNTITVFF